MKTIALDSEQLISNSPVEAAGSVAPYDGIYGRFVGSGHVAEHTRTCMICGKGIGDYHADDCPESHRNLNAQRPFDEFSLDENLIIEELSGIPFRGTFWGGFGDSVTDAEIRASAPSPDRARYLPPTSRTLQEAINLVRAHFSAAAKEHAPQDVRAWARQHGYQVGHRGRLSSDVVAAYRRAQA